MRNSDVMFMKVSTFQIEKRDKLDDNYWMIMLSLV